MEYDFARLVREVAVLKTVPSINPGRGRVLIEIASDKDRGLQVTVMRTCNEPETVEFVEAILQEMIRIAPHAIIKRGSPDSMIERPAIASHKRGGPAGTPEGQKMKIVRGWLEVRGRMNQEIYSYSQGVTSSTLRRWVRQLRETGKL